MPPTPEPSNIQGKVDLLIQPLRGWNVRNSWMLPPSKQSLSRLPAPIRVGGTVQVGRPDLGWQGFPPPARPAQRSIAVQQPDAPLERVRQAPSFQTRSPTKSDGRSITQRPPPVKRNTITSRHALATKTPTPRGAQPQTTNQTPPHHLRLTPAGKAGFAVAVAAEAARAASIPKPPQISKRNRSSHNKRNIPLIHQAHGRNNMPDKRMSARLPGPIIHENPTGGQPSKQPTALPKQPD